MNGHSLIWENFVVSFKCRRFLFVLLWLIPMQALPETARALAVSYAVNNPRLLTSPEAVWKASLDTMSANGVHMVRTAIGKATTLETMVGFLRYAEHQGAASALALSTMPHAGSMVHRANEPVAAFIGEEIRRMRI